MLLPSAELGSAVPPMSSSISITGVEFEDDTANK